MPTLENHREVNWQDIDTLFKGGRQRGVLRCRNIFFFLIFFFYETHSRPIAKISIFVLIVENSICLK